MIIKLLNEHHFEFLSFKGGCTGLSESTLVKIPHCSKSHDNAELYTYNLLFPYPLKLVAPLDMVTIIAGAAETVVYT